MKLLKRLFGRKQTSADSIEVLDQPAAPVAIDQPEPLEDWQQKIVNIRTLCAQRAREYQLAKGGRIIDSDHTEGRQR